MQQNSTPTSDQAASLAYALWERAGRPAGRDQEFWLKAERQLATEAKPTPDSKGKLRPKSSPMPSMIVYKLRSQPKIEYPEKATMNATTQLAATQKRTAPAKRAR